MKISVHWEQLGLVLALLIVGLFQMATAQPNTQLSGNFVATVRLGPDKDMVWKGVLKLSVDASGAVSGTLETPGATVVKVSGTVVNHSVTLVFDLGGKYIFGTGGIDYDIFHDPKIMGGTLSGPGEGDIGDWGYAIGG